jgi:hypothetical protein
MFFSPKRLLGILLPVAFVLIVITCIHFSSVIEYDPDEGMNLMPAYLHMKGYALYKDILIDQPPLLMLMLSSLFHVSGPSVPIARLFIVVFSALLMWTLYQIVSRTQNTLSAVWAVGLVTLFSHYLKLSVAVMNSMPTIALTMLSVYGLLLYQESYKTRHVVFSGAAFALALMTKFIALVFLPGIIVQLIIIERSRVLKNHMPARPVGACIRWFGAFFVVGIYIAFIATSIDFSQIIHPYILARQTHLMAKATVFKYLGEGFDVVLLALGGLIFLRRGQRNFLLIPLITLIVEIIIFSNHRPLWPQYRFYMGVPLGWLASFGIYALFQYIKAEWKTKRLKKSSLAAVTYLMTAALIVLAGAPIKYRRMIGQLNHREPGGSAIMAIMKKYSGQTHVVVTDRPIYAFYAGLPVPPSLATPSLKRLVTGFLKPSDYLRSIQEERPEMVLFARFPGLRDAVVPHIRQDYVLEYGYIHGLPQLYVLKRVKESAHEKGR